ncbi:c-type cytochrome [Arenicella sp. 4NH20-0111]|uniref:c-type cytochrome n=1 Tax=Arenicella sp. 4NH20-0111 TaxID=3127648 RepID=UPI003103A13D
MNQKPRKTPLQKPARFNKPHQLWFITINLLVLLILSGASHSNNANHGKQLYAEQCASCHGLQGQGNTVMEAPALAAQLPTYTIRQIMSFQTGLRGPQDRHAQQMSAIANSVGSDDSYRKIAFYLDTLSPVNLDEEELNKTPQGDVKQGYKQYQASCGGCHGDKAQGNAALESPRLSGLSPDYLKRQYQYFLNGKRGSSKKNKYGRQMTMIANTVRDPRKIDDIIAYLQTLNAAK